MRMCRTLTGALVAVAVLGLFSQVSGAASDSTRSIMSGIFDSLQRLLGAALEPEVWGGDDSARVLVALEDLKRESAKLSRKDGSASVSFVVYGQSLANAAAKVQTHYETGERELARRDVFRLVDSCVACHTRLPADDSKLSLEFVTGERIAMLPLDQRAVLQTATRQFEAALQSYESILRSPAFSPADIDRMGIVDEYLTLCLHVRSDPTRAQRNLRVLQRRSAQDEGFAADLQHWIEALSETPSLLESPRIEQVRSLVGSAENQEGPRKESNALIEYLAASAMLHRIVEDAERPRPERAEAYYLLGVVESRTGRVFWPAPEESYLEKAIRLAPGTELSLRSFHLWRELVVFGHTGSGGTRMPPELRERVRELEVLSKVPTG